MLDLWTVNKRKETVFFYYYYYIGIFLRFCLNLQIPGGVWKCSQSLSVKILAGVCNCFLVFLDQMHSGERSRFWNSVGVAFKTYILNVSFILMGKKRFRLINSFLQLIADQCYRMNWSTLSS